MGNDSPKGTAYVEGGDNINNNNPLQSESHQIPDDPEERTLLK
jgi:hypothetical protein